jgi:class 3 adenylate cyclase
MSTPPGARPGRTLTASILFVDLVGFSLTTVSEQISVKQALTAMLRNTLAVVPPEDYRIMDTGDGAAIGFLADPEHALYFALAIDSKCRQSDVPAGLHHGALRMGINFGPVKDVVDVNDRPSLIGDGINAAQRVISFAEPGQITVSYAYFDLVSRLAPEYSGLFVDAGAHDDKHGRGHEIYVLKPSRDVLEKVRARLELAVAEATGVQVVLPAAERTKPPAETRAPPSESRGSGASTAKHEPARPPSREPPKSERDFEWPIALAVGAGVLLILGSLVAVLPGWLNQESPRPAPTSMTPAPASPAAASTAPAAALAPARAEADAAPERTLTRERPATRETAAQPAAVTKPSPPATARGSANAPVTQEAICSSILHKASLGEPLTTEERKTIVACR